MTTSYLLGHKTLLDISGMYLGLQQAIYERTHGKSEESLWRVDWIDKRLKEIEGFGLLSIEEYFHHDTKKWVDEIRETMGRIRKNKSGLGN